MNEDQDQAENLNDEDEFKNTDSLDMNVSLKIFSIKIIFDRFQE